MAAVAAAKHENWTEKISDRPCCHTCASVTDLLTGPDLTLTFEDKPSRERLCCEVLVAPLPPAPVRPRPKQPLHPAKLSGVLLVVSFHVRRKDCFPVDIVLSGADDKALFSHPSYVLFRVPTDRRTRQRGVWVYPLRFSTECPRPPIPRQYPLLFLFRRGIDLRLLDELLIMRVLLACFLRAGEENEVNWPMLEISGSSSSMLLCRVTLRPCSNERASLLIGHLFLAEKLPRGLRPSPLHITSGLLR